jgi:hypothetical protein
MCSKHPSLRAALLFRAAWQSPEVDRRMDAQIPFALSVFVGYLVYSPKGIASAEKASQ